MDAFFTSVEQRDHPELRGKPVMVGGSSDRGVVAAASYEARRFGVHSAMPTAIARRLCPDGIFVRGNMKSYSRESRKIFEVFRRYSPLVQGLSLDEAFLDVTGTERLLGTPVEIAERLRAEVRAETELAVSVGIAPVKMVAKIASDSAKPDGLFEVTEKGLRDFLDPLPVARLWGVGPVAEAKLNAAGFFTVGDLSRATSRRLEATLGPWGEDVANLARGRELSEVEPYREPVSYSEENTFGHDVDDRATLAQAIIAHAEAVARRLRNDGLRAYTVMLKLKLARRTSSGPRGYPLLTRRVTLEVPTDDGAEISQAAAAQLARIALAEPVRLLGVGVTNLKPAGAASVQQIDLFAPVGHLEQRQNLNRALDEIRDRFGGNAVTRGGADAPRAGLSFQIKRGTGEEDEG